MSPTYPVQRVRWSNPAWSIAIAASLLACSAPKPPNASEFLLDLPVAVDQPLGQVPLPESGFDPIEGRAGGYAGYVALNAGDDRQDAREALITPDGTSLRYTLNVPDRTQPRLRMALGSVLERERRSGNEPHRIGFALDLESPEGTTRLVNERLRTRRHDRWRQREIDLTPWRGERVTLTFHGQSAKFSAAAWANPEIVSGVAEQSPAATGNLILISLDTLRADRLGVYGYDGDTSPNLDRFAAAAYTFLDATAQSTWTRPSHQAMLSGLYPESREGLEYVALAELLRDSGWRTEAWTEGVQLHPRYRFHRGFQRFQIRDWVADPQAVLDRLADVRQRPLFLFLHTYEPHDPYDHPELAAEPAAAESRVDAKFDVRINNRLRPLSRAERKRASQLYDADIRYLDRQMGVLLAGLQQVGLLETTTVVITSDHGEEFWEHGVWFHGKTFHRASVEVPLIVHVPAAWRKDFSLESPPLRPRSPVRLVDLYPSLAELLDVAVDHRIQGRSLLPLLRGESLPPVPIYSEGLFRSDDEGRSIRDGRYKLIWRFNPDTDDEPRIRLYDLVEDPGETRDIAAQSPEVTERLLELMQVIAAGRVVDEEVAEEDLDPEHRERLRALGYL